MSFKVLDVSTYQGHPEWGKVKASNLVDGVIMRVMGAYIDPTFEYNFEETGKVRLARGAYRYSYAMSVSQAETEALEMLSVLHGRVLEMGVFVDLEYDPVSKLGADNIKDIAKAWIRVIEEGGYPCGIYCNYWWYTSFLQGLNTHYWIARVPVNDDGELYPNIRPKVGECGWQYTHNGRVYGINGNVDISDWSENPFTYLSNAQNSPKTVLNPGELYVVSVGDVWTLEEAKIAAMNYPAAVIHKVKILE